MSRRPSFNIRFEDVGPGQFYLLCVDLTSKEPSEPFPTGRALGVASAEQLVRDSRRRLDVRQFAQGEADHRAGRHSPGLMARLEE